MRLSLVILAFTAYAVADQSASDDRHGHHEEHHPEHRAVQNAPTIVYSQPAEPAPTYSQPPVHNAHSYPQSPEPTYSQPQEPTYSHHQVPSSPSYSKPSAPMQYDEEGGYYYYYYPNEEKKEDFWSKMMEKLYINKMLDTASEWYYYQTARTDLIVPGATTFMMGAASAAGAMIIFPVIGRTLTSFSLFPFDFETLRTTVVNFIERNFNAFITSRDLDFDMDDIKMYANTIIEAINKEY